MVDQGLTLLSVHAHPDDESSKGAGTVAKYHAEGIKTVLVCCTGGEAGDILNPAMEIDEVRADLPAYRLKELDEATEIIGYDHVELLGYRDSGMAGSAANQNPDCFARVDETEAVGRLVALLRKYRPDVVVTYGDEQEIYPHPDHLRVHDVSVAACAAAADSDAYPDAGDAWKVKKLYYSVRSLKKLRLWHDMLLALGIDSPFPSDWSAFEDNEHRITTQIDVSDWLHIREAALRAHATQIDPKSPMWFGLSPELQIEVNGVDDYVLAQSDVQTSTPENDLFAGLRKGS